MRRDYLRSQGFKWEAGRRVWAMPANQAFFRLGANITSDELACRAAAGPVDSTHLMNANDLVRQAQAGPGVPVAAVRREAELVTVMASSAKSGFKSQLTAGGRVAAAALSAA